jgi:hypothetical protein
MKVMVYWNLHKGLWSVKALEGPDKGRVIARVDSVLLRDVPGKVSQAGRQRVLNERKKNVHAGLVGTWNVKRYSNQTDIECALEDIADRITYNPYRYESFVHAVDESRFEGSAYALLTGDRQVFVA